MKSIHTKKCHFLLIYFTLFITSITNAQTDSTTLQGFFVSPKLGLYNLLGDRVGYVAGGELNYLRNETIFSVNYTSMNELQGLLIRLSPEEYFRELGFKVGKYQDSGAFRLQYQAGLAAIWGLKRTNLLTSRQFFFDEEEYESEQFTTVGLISKLGFKIVPAQFISIGVDMHININVQKFLYMPLLCIELGKLK